jgi:hypothetical protein
METRLLSSSNTSTPSPPPPPFPRPLPTFAEDGVAKLRQYAYIREQESLGLLSSK